MDVRFFIGRATAGPNATLVSRYRTATASNTSGAFAATNGVDGSYDTVWKASALPVTYEIDITGLGLTWTAFSWLVNYTNFRFDPTFVDPTQTPISPGDYTIEKFVSGSWGSAIVTVTDNILQARVHLVDLTSATAVRISVTESIISPEFPDGTTPSEIQVDLWDVASCINGGHTLLTCGLLTVGDSITATGLALSKRPTSLARPAMGDGIWNLTGKRAIQVNAGDGGYRAATIDPYISDWIDAYPFKYVTFNFGTNDAIFATDPADYQSTLNAHAALAISKGRIPIIPTIPWCGAADVTPFNAKIALVLAANPTALAGPNLYAYYNAHQSLIDVDGIHPTGAGYVAYTTQWVNFCVSRGIF